MSALSEMINVLSEFLSVLKMYPENLLTPSATCSNGGQISLRWSHQKFDDNDTLASGTMLGVGTIEYFVRQEGQLVPGKERWYSNSGKIPEDLLKAIT